MFMKSKPFSGIICNASGRVCQIHVGVTENDPNIQSGVTHFNPQISGICNIKAAKWLPIAPNIKDGLNAENKFPYSDQ